MESPFIFFQVTAIPENFDEAGYLRANPDVAFAVRQGSFASGRDHFNRHGRAEGRPQMANVDLDALRRNKLDRVRGSVTWELEHTFNGQKPNFLTSQLVEQSRIAATDNVSSLGYDGMVGNMIARHAQGLVLDAGAGLRNSYYPNVINYEIVDYDTTDILGVCECLPFRDCSFDAVISVAVLEHVQDPFQCAREIARVLKPGGELFCSIPFLQPLHGFPHHYFNATGQGIRRLFDASLEIIDVTVLPSTHPLWALQWILMSWREGLSPEVASDFDRLAVGDILRATPEQLKAPYCADLSMQKQLEIASATVLTAVKSGS